MAASLARSSSKHTNTERKRDTHTHTCMGNLIWLLQKGKPNGNHALFGVGTSLALETNPLQICAMDLVGLAWKVAAQGVPVIAP